MYHFNHLILSVTDSIIEQGQIKAKLALAHILETKYCKHRVSGKTKSSPNEVIVLRKMSVLNYCAMMWLFSFVLYYSRMTSVYYL